MRKSKILASAVSVALVASIAATAAISASAIGSVEEIKDHKMGIVGSFNNWSTEGEVPMNDDDGDGIWEGTVDIENVTAEMIVEATMDDGAGNQIPRGKTGITFKVRLDSNWADSWGDYEASYVRTGNSQTNCVVEAKEGTHVKIHVKLDTTRNAPEAIEAGEVEATDPVDYLLIPVSYTVEEVAAAAAPATQTSAAPATQTSTATTTTPAASTATTTTSTPAGTTSANSPATGDTTSAIALVAVVLASLGTAVVMTKKASAKD